MSGVVRAPDGSRQPAVYGRMQGLANSPSCHFRQMPMPCAVSVPDDDLRSTERSLLGTLAGVLSAVPDYLFAWLVERDEEAVPLFESRRLAQTLGRQVPLGPLDLLRAAVEPSQARAPRGADPRHVGRQRGDRRAPARAPRRRRAPRGHAGRDVHARAGRRHPRGGRDPRILGPPDARNDELEQRPRRCRGAGGPAASAQAVLADQNRQLAEISTTDYLTGAHNRRHFMDVLQAEIRRRHRVDPPACCCSTSTGSRPSTTRYGHIAGDAVLITVAKRLRAVIREYDTVARYGGEEFAVLLPEIPDTTRWPRARTPSGARSRCRRSRRRTGAELAIMPFPAARPTWTAGETDEALIERRRPGAHAAKRAAATSNPAGVVTDQRGAVLADQPEAFQWRVVWRSP